MVLRIRRHIRGGQEMRNSATIGSAVELSAMHLLLVPSTVHPDEVDELVRARVPGSEIGRTGFVTLGRHSRLTGPYELSMEEAVDAAVPMPWTVVYALSAPVEREDPPMPGLDDRDGFAHAFPHGLPWREEGRALQLLVAMARRLHGAVRAAGGGLMIHPDPDRSVDVIIHSPFWLDPGVVLGVVQRVLPNARLEIESTVWNGPSDDVYSGAALSPYLEPHQQLSQQQLAQLHHRADQMDLAALAAEDVIDGFAVAAEVDPWAGDGAVEVLVHVGRDREPAVQGQTWATQPFVTYEVRWAPNAWQERERRHPSPAFVHSRSRVQPLIREVARAIVEATGGVVTDEDGFWLDRYAL